MQNPLSFTCIAGRPYRNRLILSLCLILQLACLYSLVTFYSAYWLLRPIDSTPNLSDTLHLSCPMQQIDSRNFCGFSNSLGTRKNFWKHSFNWLLRENIVLYCIVFSIYPPDSEESEGGAMHREAITPTCFRRYRDIAVRLIFFFFFFLIEIRMIVIWNCLLIRQAEEIIAKCLSQEQ